MTRFAIVSAPRSGNSWVRRVLCDALGIEEDAQHNYLDFRDMPDAIGIQIHWPREPNFQKFLKDNGFRPVVMLRHPLDILCSVMHFIQHEPATSRWLEGNADIPSDLVGQDPASDAVGSPLRPPGALQRSRRAQAGTPGRMHGAHDARRGTPRPAAGSPRGRGRARSSSSAGRAIYSSGSAGAMDA